MVLFDFLFNVLLKKKKIVFTIIFFFRLLNFFSFLFLHDRPKETQFFLLFFGSSFVNRVAVRCGRFGKNFTYLYSQSVPTYNDISHVVVVSIYFSPLLSPSLFCLKHRRHHHYHHHEYNWSNSFFVVITIHPSATVVAVVVVVEFLFRAYFSVCLTVRRVAIPIMLCPLVYLYLTRLYFFWILFFFSTFFHFTPHVLHSSYDLLHSLLYIVYSYLLLHTNWYICCIACKKGRSIFFCCCLIAKVFFFVLSFLTYSGTNDKSFTLRLKILIWRQYQIIYNYI